MLNSPMASLWHFLQLRRMLSILKARLHLIRPLLLIAVLVALPASAAEQPASISSHFKSTKPLGSGIYTRFGLEAYDAQLWTDALAFTFKQPFALRLHYDWDFKRDDIVKRSADELSHIGIADATIARYLPLMKKSFPDIHKGDTLTAVYESKDRILFYHNDTLFNTVTDTTFPTDFLNIWLSTKTSAPELRNSLLGSHPHS